MRQAAVGFHCPDCAKAGRQRVYTAATIHQLQQPIAALTLIALNVAIWLAGFAVQGGQDRMQANFSLVARGPFYRGGPVVGIGQGEWWRIITAGFLHLSWIHIISNMIALWVLGQLCERLVGSWRFVLVYAVSLVAGSLGALIVDPHVSSAGASGAIFGLFGLLIVAAWARGIDLRHSGLLTWLIIDLVFTFTIPGISVGAHVGGLIGGAVAGLAVVELPRRLSVGAPRTREWAGMALAGAIGVACFFGALAVAASTTVPLPAGLG
jgi:membrane associated rhomboid family serine protease